MKLNNSTHWSNGYSKVASQVNTQYHHTERNVPCILTFGHQPRIGISNPPLDPAILGTLHTEVELNWVTNLNHSLIDDPAIENPDSLE